MSQQQNGGLNLGGFDGNLLLPTQFSSLPMPNVVSSLTNTANLMTFNVW